MIPNAYWLETQVREAERQHASELAARALVRQATAGRPSRRAQVADLLRALASRLDDRCPTYAGSYRVALR